MRELQIKIVSRSGYVPSYETEGSAGADLRAGEVLEDGDGLVFFFGDFADERDLGGMLFVGAVGEVQAGDIHARVDHAAEGLAVFGGRADGAYNFCFSHIVLR